MEEAKWCFWNIYSTEKLKINSNNKFRIFNTVLEEKLPYWQLNLCCSCQAFQVMHDEFDVHGSVHHKYIPIYIQQDAPLHILFISGNCSTCFGWYFHPSSGVHTTVSTASGICHTITATCCYRGGVGTTPPW